MATKHGWMLTCLDGLLPTKSHDSLIKWSCEITWQNKPFNLQYHQSHGYQLCSQMIYLKQLLVVRPFVHVQLLDHVTI